MVHKTILKQSHRVLFCEQQCEWQMKERSVSPRTWWDGCWGLLWISTRQYRLHLNSLSLRFSQKIILCNTTNYIAVPKAKAALVTQVRPSWGHLFFYYTWWSLKLLHLVKARCVEGDQYRSIPSYSSNCGSAEHRHRQQCAPQPGQGNAGTSILETE